VTPNISLSEGAGHWWIQTWNTDGYGLWSDAMSIAVGESLGKVTLTAPSGTLDTLSPIYTWDAVNGASWYFLWVNNGQGNVLQKWYRSSEVDCESGSGTCSVAPGLELEAGADYQWWIQPWNESEGNGPWSDAMRFSASAGGGGDYPGGKHPESAQEIPLNQQVSLSPVYDTEWNNQPQKYGNYQFHVENDGEVTLDIQAAKVGGSWMQVKESSQGTVVTEKWVPNDSSGTTDSFKVKAGESYTFFINKNGADIETIGLKVNFSASELPPPPPWELITG
jgi:phenolic acid decarboxylase